MTLMTKRSKVSPERVKNSILKLEYYRKGVKATPRKSEGGCFFILSDIYEPT